MQFCIKLLTNKTMNALLRNIADNASTDIARLIEEGAEDILKAIHKTEEEAQANEAKPKFSLGFKITVDFDAASYNCDLSWSLKQTLGTTHQIDDPNQPKLPMDESEGTVTISTPGMEPVTLTRNQFSKAAKKLGGK